MSGPVGFQVRLGEDWIDYPDAASTVILQAYEAGESKANFVLGIEGKKVPMFIDFQEMLQVNVVSQRKYPVRQPWDFLKPKEVDETFDDVDQEEYTGSGNNTVAKGRKMLNKIMMTTKDFKKETKVDVLEAWRKELNEIVKEVLKMGLAEKEVLPVRDRLRKVHNQVQDLKGCIRVYARTRPLNQREKDNMSKTCFDFDKNRMHVNMEDSDGHKNRYTFDTTFAPGTQTEIFTELEDLIQSTYDGFNVTVFAYGQTGAGKTYTMYGPNPDPRADPGVVMRSIDKIFDVKKSYGPQYKTSVHLSMVEMYNQNIIDLLGDDSKKAAAITVRKAADGEVILQGSEFHPCSNTDEAWRFIDRAFVNRKTAATAMNSESSRSHLILRLRVNIHNTKSGQELKGKLILVDLAGSERVKNSLVEGDNLKEAIEINKSLTALGDVMEKLTMGSKAPGYRNHLLTQVLADSLGGTAKTLMFANLSPATLCYGETKMTCEWATRARKIENAKDTDKKSAPQPKAPQPKASSPQSKTSTQQGGKKPTATAKKPVTPRRK